MPDDAVLFIEGPLARDVKDFLRRHSVTAPTDVERGTLWPKLETFHLPLKGTNLAELREIAERHAGPEVCDHLVVYRRDEPLLWAHDAGDGYVLITKTMAPETISQLERALGEALRRNLEPVHGHPRPVEAVLVLAHVEDALGGLHPLVEA
jgi:hypothetical protein